MKNDKTADELTIHEIEPWKVRGFLDRPRDPDEFQRSLENIREFGQIQPGKVRDIRHLPKEERKREDGRYYEFERVYGQGRLEICEKLGIKFKATIKQGKQIESVPEFLIENTRLPLPPLQRARLLKRKMETDGMTEDQVFDALHVEPVYGKKLLKIVTNTAKGLEKQVDAMAVNDAQAFTALPAAHQKIVMQVAKETKHADIMEVVREARALTPPSGDLSALAIKESMKGKEKELREVKERLKPHKLHFELRAVNLLMHNADAKFAKALKSEGIDLSRFLAVCGSELVTYYTERALEAAKSK